MDRWTWHRDTTEILLKILFDAIQSHTINQSIPSFNWEYTHRTLLVTSIFSFFHNVSLESVGLDWCNINCIVCLASSSELQLKNTEIKTKLRKVYQFKLNKVIYSNRVKHACFNDDIN